MGITGNDPALMYARSSSATGTGTGLLRPARCGATRLGFRPPTLILTVAGAARTTNFERDTWQISERASGQNNQLTIDVFGFAPAVGQEISLNDGGPGVLSRLFRGTIVRVSRQHRRLNEGRIVYRCTCLDWQYQLGQALVTKRYNEQSATAIVLDLMTSFAPSGFTTVHVQAGLPTVTGGTAFTLVSLASALKQVADRIGAYYFVDFEKDVHVFTTAEGGAGPEPLTTANRHISEVTHDKDIEGVRNRIWVEGLGSTVRAPMAAGSTTIPVDDASMFQTGGTFYAKLEAQIITYAGVQLGATGAAAGSFLAPPAQIVTVTAGGGSGSMASSSSFTYAVVYVTARGTTVAGTGQTGTSSATGSMSLSGIPVPSDSAVISKVLYRSGAGGGQLKVHHTLALETSSYDDFMADGQLGANAPSTSTALVEVLTPAGSTSLSVEQTSGFLSGGGWAEGPGGQVFSYTGRSTSSGAGNLTGIPASGVGALTASIRSGTVRALPHLTGVPASGAGAIANALTVGEGINLFVGVGDATSQATYGIRETSVQDRRLIAAAATDRAAAVLALLKDPRMTGSLRSTDSKSHAGRPFVISMAADWGIDLTVRIEAVTWKPEKGKLYPQAEVQFASRSLEDIFVILREIKERALIR